MAGAEQFALLSFHLLAHPAVITFLAFCLGLAIHAGFRKRWGWLSGLLLFPPIAPVYFFIALQGSSDQGNLDRIRVAELEKQIRQTSDPHLRLELADIRFRAGNYEDARMHYAAALLLDAESTDIKGHLAQCLLKLARMEEAQLLFEDLCMSDPDHDEGESLLGLAEARLALGNEAGARQIWEQSIANYPYAQPRVRLAELLLREGEKGRARQLVEEVLREKTSTDSFQHRQEAEWTHRARQVLDAVYSTKI
jgi:hypothetical protein